MVINARVCGKIMFSYCLFCMSVYVCVCVCVCVCVSVCLCVCLFVCVSGQAITFECLDIETSFLVGGTS